jgi:hypothetical protein
LHGYGSESYVYEEEMMGMYSSANDTKFYAPLPYHILYQLIEVYGSGKIPNPIETPLASHLKERNKGMKQWNHIWKELRTE